MLFVGVFALLIIPDRIDSNGPDEEEEKTINVPYSAILKNSRAFMACLIYFLTAVGFCFYEPILSVRLYELGMSDENVAVGFILSSTTYALGSILIGPISERVDKRAVIFISFILFSVSIFLSGGSSSESLTISLVGLALAGFF